MRILLGRDFYAPFIGGADRQMALPGGGTVGTRNDAPTASTYRLTIGPTSAALESRDVMFSGAQQWQVYVAFTASWPPGATVVANTYAGGATIPFRVVRLAPQPSSSL